MTGFDGQMTTTTIATQWEGAKKSQTHTHTQAKVASYVRGSGSSDMAANCAENVGANSLPADQNGLVHSQCLRLVWFRMRRCTPDGRRPAAAQDGPQQEQEQAAPVTRARLPSNYQAASEDEPKTHDEMCKLTKRPNLLFEIGKTGVVQGSPEHSTLCEAKSAPHKVHRELWKPNTAASRNPGLRSLIRGININISEERIQQFSTNTREVVE